MSKRTHKKKSHPELTFATKPECQAHGDSAHSRSDWPAGDSGRGDSGRYWSSSPSVGGSAWRRGGGACCDGEVSDFTASG